MLNVPGDREYRGDLGQGNMYSPFEKKDDKQTSSGCNKDGGKKIECSGKVFCLQHILNPTRKK